ncbi:OSCP/delta subunit of ATPase [Entophlyctis helioformis]|nr:OSCP/delta subunit of ATPase [Entophlyctis helioformis]
MFSSLVRAQRIVIARGFSSSAAASAAAPITLHGIDGRYATALYTAAVKQNLLEKVEGELKIVDSVINKDAGVKTFLESPLLDRLARKEGVKALLAQGRYSPITANFFDLLAENGRLDQTKKIISAFGQIMMAARGELNVTVTSAKELDSRTLNKLRDVLSKSSLVEKGAKLIVANKVDPEIIGGLIIEVGDKTIDMSVSSKVTKLNALLSQAV